MEERFEKIFREIEEIKEIKEPQTEKGFEVIQVAITDPKKVDDFLDDLGKHIDAVVEKFSKAMAGQGWEEGLKTDTLTKAIKKAVFKGVIGVDVSGATAEIAILEKLNAGINDLGRRNPGLVGGAVTVGWEISSKVIRVEISYGDKSNAVTLTKTKKE